MGLCAAAVLAPVVPAQAATNPTFTSTYDMVYRVYGATNFTVNGDGYVNVHINQTYGGSTPYLIRIERKVCGFFGCNWKANYVGGDCTRTLSNTTPKDCSFYTGTSGNPHRVVLTKADDGNRVKGDVTVK